MVFAERLRIARGIFGINETPQDILNSQISKVFSMSTASVAVKEGVANGEGMRPGVINGNLKKSEYRTNIE